MSTLHYPEDECLPIIDPSSHRIIDIATRTKIHQEGLYHGHVNVWVPGQGSDILIVQRKKRHGKCDATIGGHIDCDPGDREILLGKNIREIAPKTAVKEGREETGLVLTENDIIPLGIVAESHAAPHLESGSWNNGIVLAYMLNRRMALKEILDNTDREDNLDFEEVEISTLMNLTEQDSRGCLAKLARDPYKELFRKMQKEMKGL